jgi:hypothetical protein
LREVEIALGTSYEERICTYVACSHSAPAAEYATEVNTYVGTTGFLVNLGRGIHAATVVVVPQYGVNDDGFWDQ